MSYQAVTWVLENSHSIGAARLVLICIGSHANEHGLNSWPCQETIAKETRLNLKSVRRAIKNLVVLGELKATAPHETGRGRGYIYSIPMVSAQRELPIPEAKGTSNIPGTVPPFRVPHTVINRGTVPPFRGEKRVENFQEGGHLVTEGGHPVPRRGALCPPNSIEPSKIEQTPRENHARLSSPELEVDQRQKLENRERRVMAEVYGIRESIAGAGPGLEADVGGMALARIAGKMESLQPKSQAEYERRRQAQQRALREKYPAAFA